MSDETLIILHLLKTGGTAIRNYIDGAIPLENRISWLGDEAEAESQIQRLSDMSAEQRARIKVVFGHFAGKFRPHFPGAKNVTVVREPLARLVSQYVYERHNAEELGIAPEDRRLLGEVSMPEFCDSILRMGRKATGGNFNLQARTIGDYLGVAPDSVRERDIPGFIEQFDIIGLQEHFALFIFLLYGYHGYPLNPVPVVYSFSDYGRNYFPQWFVAECRKYGHIDFRLYELAKAKFDNDVNRLFGKSVDIASKWENYRRATSEMLEHQIMEKYGRLPAERKQKAMKPLTVDSQDILSESDSK